MRLAGRTFNKYQKFLQIGTYELNHSGTCFNRKDVEEVDSVADFATEVTGRNRFRIRKQYRVKQSNSEFRCTKMLLTDGRNTVKCFDFDAGIVISVFAAEDRMSAWLRKKEIAGSVFASSKVLECNREECYVIEELLRDTVSSAEEKWLCVLKYYSEHSFVLNEEMQDRMFQRYDLKLPVVYQHGDLWSANVFCDGTTCKVIDFDHADLHMFFYDLALYMFTEAFIRKDKALLERYLQGKYDSWIDKICTMHGVEYKSVGPKRLFACAMEEMISTRFHTRTGKQVTKSIVGYLKEMGIHI